MRRGLSLVEVVFATALLASTLFAIIGIVPTALSAAKKAQYVVAATNLAQETMESCLAESFDTLVSIPDNTVPIENISYHYAIDVTAGAVRNGRDYLKTVTVRVWAGTNTPVILSSCIYRVSH